MYAKDHAIGKDSQAPANVEELEVEKNDDKLDDIHEDVNCTIFMKTWTAHKLPPLAVMGKNRMLKKRKEEFKVVKIIW